MGQNSGSVAPQLSETIGALELMPSPRFIEKIFLARFFILIAKFSHYSITTA
jgi:hypothetical protein